MTDEKARTGFLSASKEEFDMLAQKPPYIERAYQKLKVIRDQAETE